MLIRTTRHQITSACNLINFQVVFFVDNFREFANLNVVYEEIFKLHILIELGQEYF